MGGERNSDDDMSSCSSSNISYSGKRRYGRTARLSEGNIATGSVGNLRGDANAIVEFTPRKRKRQGGVEIVAGAAAAAATRSESSESVAQLKLGMICQTTADIGAGIMRETEKVERIASISSNLKSTLLALGCHEDFPT
jgi:hypothetical protein